MTGARVRSRTWRRAPASPPPLLPPRPPPRPALPSTRRRAYRPPLAAAPPAPPPVPAAAARSRAPARVGWARLPTSDTAPRVTVQGAQGRCPSHAGSENDSDAFSSWPACALGLSAFGAVAYSRRHRTADSSRPRSSPLHL